MTNQPANIYSLLSEPFPQEMERSINKGGVNLTYIPVSEVINRLNKVLGVDKWSMTIQRCERDALDPDFVVAHVRIEYFVGEFATIVRDGIGGQKIKRTKSGQILDLGDEFKGAISDALKKAAQAFGVGLYLARSEDAIEIEQAMDAEYADEEADSHNILWSNFVAVVKGFNKDQKEALRKSWGEHSNGQPVPSSASAVNGEQLGFLITEAMKLQFPGSSEVPKNENA